MASSEDIECLNSVCQALEEILTSPYLQPHTEQQVIELLPLVPQVLRADEHAGRWRQLHEVCHPLRVVTSFLSPALHHPFQSAVRMTALEALKEISTAPVLTTDPTEGSKSVLEQQLRDSFAASMLLALATHNGPSPSAALPPQQLAKTTTLAESISAAQLLFIVTMTLPQFRDDVRRAALRQPGGLTNGPLVCSALNLTGSSGAGSQTAEGSNGGGSPQLQQYLSGMLRVLAASYPQELTAMPERFSPSKRLIEAATKRPSSHPTHSSNDFEGRGPLFLELLFRALAKGTFATSKVAILWMEIGTHLLTQFPSVYWTLVASPRAAGAATSAAKEQQDSPQYLSSFARHVEETFHRFFVGGGSGGFSIFAGEGLGGAPNHHHSAYQGSSQAQQERDTELKAFAALWRVCLTIEGPGAPQYMFSGSGGPSSQTETDNSVHHHNNNWNPAFGRIAEKQVWVTLCSKAALQAAAPSTALLVRIHLLRVAAAVSYRRHLQGWVAECFLAAFPHVCNVLAPARSASNSSAVSHDITPSGVSLTTEVALLMSLVCAKSPSVRLTIREMVSGYGSWAAVLHGRLRHLVGAYFRAPRGGGGGGGALSATAAGTTDNSSNASLPPFEPLLLVDMFHQVMNDGDQAQHVDMIDEQRVAKALLHEQERRYAKRRVGPNSGGGSSAADTTDEELLRQVIPLDVALLDGFVLHTFAPVRYGQASDWSEKAIGLCSVLGEAVLCHAAAVAFRQSDVPPDALSRTEGQYSHNFSPKNAAGYSPVAPHSYQPEAAQHSHQSPPPPQSTPKVATSAVVPPHHGQQQQNFAAGGQPRSPLPSQSPPPVRPTASELTIRLPKQPEQQQQQQQYGDTSHGGTPTRFAAGAAGAPPPSESTSRYDEWIEHMSQRKKKTVASVFEPVRAKSPFRPATPRGTTGTPTGGLVSTPRRATTPRRPTTPSSTSQLKKHPNIVMGPQGTPMILLEGRGASRAAPPPAMRRTNASTAASLSVIPKGTSILDVMRKAPLDSEEYLSMAITMFLPIKFGSHYNRSGKTAVRKVVTPQGVFVQPLHRNEQLNWTVADVRVGELHVVFIPFHKLTAETVEAEIVHVEERLVDTTKNLVTTPITQRSRRCFLQDMQTTVLPKTELILRDLLDMLLKFGKDDVVYQLGLIRMMDEGKAAKGALFAKAVEVADTAMPKEIMRLSTGAFRDIVHSGNLLYVVEQLRAHYYDGGLRQANRSGGDLGSSRPGSSPGGRRAGGASDRHDRAALNDIDREIAMLEKRMRLQNQHHPNSSQQDDPEEDDEEFHDDMDEEEMRRRYGDDDDYPYDEENGEGNHQDPQYAVDDDDDDEVRGGGRTRQQGYGPQGGSSIHSDPMHYM